jgi:hypothetical protein
MLSETRVKFQLDDFYGFQPYTKIHMIGYYVLSWNAEIRLIYLDLFSRYTN